MWLVELQMHMSHCLWKPGFICENQALCVKNRLYLWKPGFICENQVLLWSEPRHEKICLCYMRTTCASAQSDQRLCCSLPRQYNTSSFYIQNFKPFSRFCGCAGRFESTLVANPEDIVSLMRLKWSNMVKTMEHQEHSLQIWWNCLQWSWNHAASKVFIC